MPGAVAGLRILAFSDWYTPNASGGAERAAWEVYRRLGAAGAEVRVISAAHGPPHADPGVHVRVIRAADFSRLVGAYFAPAPGAFVAARNEVLAFRPQVIHASTLHYTGCIAAAWAARRWRTPLVTTVQLASIEQLPSAARRLAAVYERIAGSYILRRSRRVLVVSEAVRSHVIAFGVPDAATDLAPNGVDHERFRPRPASRSNPLLIIAVGRLLPNKGPHLLAEAAARLRREGFSFRVVFVGDGPMRQELEARYQELKLAGCMEFVGHDPEPARWYTEAEVVVRASYTEGLPLAVLEAMASARCSVVSDIPPNLELIRDGENGLTFRSGDVADLTRALRIAITEPDKREVFGRRAQQDSLQYSWDRMAAVSAQALLAAYGLADDQIEGPTSDSRRFRWH